MQSAPVPVVLHFDPVAELRFGIDGAVGAEVISPSFVTLCADLQNLFPGENEREPLRLVD